MYCMSVTLEVSKLSGWLNAYAFCQVEGRAAYDAGRGAAHAQEVGVGSGDGSRLSGRTTNMPCVVVTPEVFHVDMSALKFVV